jgi:PEP-CTERM motif
MIGVFNMSKKFAFAAATALTAAALATPATAANIVLYDVNGGFAAQGAQGAAALFAFQKAANYWNTVLTNNATVRIAIDFRALRTGVLGSTSSSSSVVTTSDIYSRLAATGNTALDAIAVANLTPLNAAGALGFRRNAALLGNALTGTGAAPNSTVFDNNNSANNFFLDVNTSVLSALGGTSTLSEGVFDTFQCSTSFAAADACITFSSNFAFDFDPTDGITAGQYDFTAVAIHELGHALGFVSGVDTYDIVAGATPGNAFGLPNYTGLPLDRFAIGSTLDLFRYGNGFDANGRQLQWAANRAAFFSIDGAIPFNFSNGSAAELPAFSNGRFVGSDGQQASHFQDNDAFLSNTPGCLISTRQIGIMDPTAAPCEPGIVTANDLAAFDALGWNLNFNILNNGGYTFDTAQVFGLSGLAAVPEASTWAMMLAGFGFVGMGMRRRRTKVSVTYA